jgi:hypothetical protein
MSHNNVPDANNSEVAQNGGSLTLTNSNQANVTSDKWIFTSEELDKAPSIICGHNPITKQKDLEYRKDVVGLMQAIGMSLKLYVPLFS